mmetsp:Transcript_47133/g.156228  ORF Transcript_47133/g.156228 Transcript_47133/m.156228 type:complete len:127 (+) Transcript_47133:639-1019(+)
MRARLLQVAEALVQRRCSNEDESGSTVASTHCHVQGEIRQLEACSWRSGCDWLRWPSHQTGCLAPSCCEALHHAKPLGWRAWIGGPPCRTAQLDARSKRYLHVIREDNPPWGDVFEVALPEAEAAL